MDQVYEYLEQLYFFTGGTRDVCALVHLPYDRLNKDRDVQTQLQFLLRTQYSRILRLIPNQHANQSTATPKSLLYQLQIFMADNNNTKRC